MLQQHLHGDVLSFMTTNIQILLHVFSGLVAAGAVGSAVALQQVGSGFKFRLWPFCVEHKGKANGWMDV